MKAEHQILFEPIRIGETTLWLLKQGKDVTVVEALDDIPYSGEKMCPSNEAMLRDLSTFHKAHIETGATVASVNEKGVRIKTIEGA